MNHLGSVLGKWRHPLWSGDMPSRPQTMARWLALGARLLQRREAVIVVSEEGAVSR